MNHNSDGLRGSYSNEAKTRRTSLPVLEDEDARGLAWNLSNIRLEPQTDCYSSHERLKSPPFGKASWESPLYPDLKELAVSTKHAQGQPQTQHDDHFRKVRIDHGKAASDTMMGHARFRRLVLAFLVVLSVWLLQQHNIDTRTYLPNLKVELQNNNNGTTVASNDNIGFFIPQEISPLPLERVTSGIGDNATTASSPLQACSVTSQVRVIATQPKWTLQTYTDQGLPKRHGGDEFYIFYKDATASKQRHPLAVALIEDLNNGTYLLDFVHPPLMNKQVPPVSTNGSLTVHFQYTCGIGQLEPPIKANWKTGGYTLTVSTQSPIPAPPMRHFQPATSNHGVKLASYDMVIAFGDSLMEQFVSTYTHGDLAHKRFFHDNVVWKQNVAQTLNSTNYPWLLDKLQAWHGADLIAAPHNKMIALILGSGLWDVLKEFLDSKDSYDPDFEDHLIAARLYIAEIRHRYPHVQLFWKSPTALHLHRLRTVEKKPEVRRRIKYLSSSRVARLHQRQQELTKELNIPYLDLFEYTYLSASWSLFGDARHYEDSVHKQALNWFYV